MPFLGNTVDGFADKLDPLGLRDPFGLFKSKKRGNSGPSADSIQADLLRRDYARYVDTYQPLEDYMFQQLGNWGANTEAAQQVAMNDVDKSFGQARAGQERDFRSMGLQMNPQQSKSLERNYDIAAAKSAVEAANRTGEQMTDLKYGLMSGSSPYKPQGGGQQ